MVFSHDSSTVVTASEYNKVVRVWNTTTGKLKYALRRDDNGHGCRPYKRLSEWPQDYMPLSHDSSLVALPTNDYRVLIWSLNTDTHSISRTRDLFFRMMKRVCSGPEEHTNEELNEEGALDTNPLISDGHSDTISMIKFSHNSTLLASASEDDTVRVWSAKTGECVQVLKGHTTSVESVAFSHDSKLIASAGWDHTVRIWNASTGQCIRVASAKYRDRVLKFGMHNGCCYVCTVSAVVYVDLPASGTNTTPTTSAVPHLTISDDEGWITWRGKKVLRLPAECRGGKIVIHGSTVMIGCESGRMMIWRLDLHELAALMD